LGLSDSHEEDLAAEDAAWPDEAAKR